MELSYIYEKFKECITLDEQKEFLTKMKESNLPYDINWDNLITLWEETTFSPFDKNTLIDEEEDLEEEDIPFFE